MATYDYQNQRELLRQRASQMIADRQKFANEMEVERKQEKALMLAEEERQRKLEEEARIKAEHDENTGWGKWMGIGSTIGGILGGIAGTFVTPGAGTAAGAAIGSSLGGLAGGALGVARNRKYDKEHGGGDWGDAFSEYGGASGIGGILTSGSIANTKLNDYKSSLPVSKSSYNPNSISIIPNVPIAPSSPSYPYSMGTQSVAPTVTTPVQNVNQSLQSLPNAGVVDYSNPQTSYETQADINKKKLMAAVMGK